MHIDFILDIGCLWSYITWCHLRTALKSFPPCFDITPFFYSPIPFFPGLSVNPADRARLIRDRAEPILRQSGIYVCFERLPDLPEDVSLPCRLILDAFKNQKGNDVLSDVFESYFTFGENICEKNVLTKIANNRGLSDAFLNTPLPENFPLLKTKELPRALPCLIFDRKTIIFGEQSVPCLKNMLSVAFCLQREKDFRRQ